MMAGVCRYVYLSIACLDLTRKRKGLERPKLAEWTPIARVTREHIYTNQKVRGQGHQAD